MRICVTGGRYYENMDLIWNVLDSYHWDEHTVDLLATGACHLGGADLIAENWAKSREVPYMGIPARFKNGSRGSAEGPLRNQKMLDTIKPGIVFAFGGGSGTNNCVAEAKKRNIEVREYERDDN